MPRLVNSRTKVVVNVSDETAAVLGGEWGPVKKAEPKKAESKKAAPHKSDK